MRFFFKDGRKNILSLILLTLLCMSKLISAASYPPKKEAAVEGVTQLTTRDFNSHMRDGNVWLIEFYAPWCGHCTHFAPIYNEIADHYHKNPKMGVKVSKIDGSQERAITQRFGVVSFPTFFLVDGFSVYKFEETRSKKNLHDFIENRHELERLPFFNSPMGPIGLFLGLLMSTGMFISDIFQWFQNLFGFSPMISILILGFVAIFGGLISMIMLVILTTPKEKND